MLIIGAVLSGGTFLFIASRLEALLESASRDSSLHLAILIGMGMVLSIAMGHLYGWGPTKRPAAPDAATSASEMMEFRASHMRSNPRSFVRSAASADAAASASELMEFRTMPFIRPAGDCDSECIQAGGTRRSL